MRYSKIIVTINGQSQAIMAGTGGAETVDTPLIDAGTAAQELDRLLEEWIPGVTAQVLCASGPGPATYTAVGGTALIRTFNNGGTAFWNDTTNSLDTHGTAQVNYLLERADPTALCIFIHWCQTADANYASWDDQDYADGLKAYYDAINSALSSSFGEFRILPICAAARDGGDTPNRNLGVIRQVMDSLGGVIPTYLGATAQSYILPPVHGTPYVVRGGYIEGSSDFIHPIRSASWRFSRAAATRIANRNGVTPPTVDPPRLSHARMINDNTLRAFFVSPAKQPFVRQGLSGFEITGGGSILDQTASFDNSNVETTGFSTIDLIVSGITENSRLHFHRNGGGYSGFVNGPIPPRGLLTNALYVNPGNTPSISDAAEDCVGEDICLFVQPNQAGVGIDSVSPPIVPEVPPEVHQRVTRTGDVRVTRTSDRRVVR